MFEQYGIFLLLAFIAEVLGTISGFGSSILFVPLASLFFEFKTVLGITAIFHVFSNLSKISLFTKGIQLQIVLWLGIPATIFVIIGASLTQYIPSQWIEVSMNIILLLLAIYLFINQNVTIEKSTKNLIVGGGISGFLAGLVGTGGAIRGLTLLAFQMPKNAFIASSAVIDLGVDLSRSVVYVYHGYFNIQYLPLMPFLLLISFLGTWIGKWLLQKTSELIFRYIVLLTILATALFQLFQWIF